MMNPASIMKMLSLKNKFEGNHPKFVSFLKFIMEKGIEEGTVIEISVKKPNQDPVVANMKVLQSDLELVQELKEVARQQ